MASEQQARVRFLAKPYERRQFGCLRLAFLGVIIVTRFGFDCYRTLGAVPWLRVTLTFAGLYGIEALPKPSLLGPSPVAIEVWIEHRPFHDDPPSMQEQSACHIGVVNFSAFFEC